MLLALVARFLIDAPHDRIELIAALLFLRHRTRSGWRLNVVGGIGILSCLMQHVAKRGSGRVGLTVSFPRSKRASSGGWLRYV